MSKLLVVDWDWFFPAVERPQDGDEWVLYDWGHAESLMFIEALWPDRAAGFVRNGLPLPKTNGLDEDFWGRFAFAADVEVFASESNSKAAEPTVADDVDEVWLYDAHHDAGYHGGGVDELVRLCDGGRWSCEDWMVLHYAQGASLHVRYPQWRHYAMDDEPAPLVPVDRQVDDGSNGPDGLVFDRVFVCRSGAWVPPWVDEDFTAFVEAAPAKAEVLGDYPLAPRAFSMEQVGEYVRMFEEMEAKLRAVTEQKSA